MRLKLGARKSDLARWQAVQVARVLETHPKKPSVEFLFKTSLGDQNLETPLWQMPERGVFTEDFLQDLLSKQCDLVVHSWKDLPVEERESTQIAMTLKRADVRDILLVPKDVWVQAQRSGVLKILTSSPRRIYNLSNCLPELLPGKIRCEFANVRGNVPTRMQKMFEQGAALVLAKAGLDRLLEGEADGYLENSLKGILGKCLFQVLPVSVNPPAPAQGALAIEVLRENQELTEICHALTDEATYACVKREREVLKRYGGGCHQKIGAAVLPKPYGLVCAMRGLTDHGEVLLDWRIENSTPWSRAKSKAAIFPLKAQDNSWFERTQRPIQESMLKGKAVFVARADAWPQNLKADGQIVWTAGVQTWKKLARLGVWVQGCQDGLGENEDKGLKNLCGDLDWIKFTHSGSASSTDLATYELKPKASGPDLKGKSHFFWMSRTSFEQAKKLYPKELAEGHHACGPGQTYEFLKSVKDLKHPVKVFINLEQFLNESLP